MFIILLCIIATIAAFLISSISVNYDSLGNVEVQFKFSKKSLLTFLVPVIILGFNSFTIVEANNVGIQYNPFAGGVSQEVLGEGFVWKNPMTKVYQLSTQIQTKTITGLTTQTKDSQYVTNDIDVKYRVNVKDAYQVYKQYKNMDNIDGSLITPTVQRAIESVTVQFNIIEILGSARNEVYQKVESELSDRFDGTGITVVSITFTDTDGGAEIEEAIRAEAVAAKKVDQAEQEKLAAQVKAEQQIIEAQAKKEVAILEAEAEAEKIRIVQDQLSKDATYIEFTKWSKWDGVLPQVMSDSNAIIDFRE